MYVISQHVVKHKMNTNQNTPFFIQAMLQPEFYSHTVEKCQLIETHISWVILTGQFAYKIKKPANFGFLDFSSLEKRKFYCEEELRLNRRLAPDIYLAVIPITGDKNDLELNGEGNVLEYAVKMKQFPQEIELDNVLNRGELNNQIIDSTAALISDFHQKIDIADESSGYGKPGTVFKPIKENIDQIRERITDKTTLTMLEQIEHWSEDTFNQLKPVLNERKQSGFIRECHGDLHLRNLAWYKNKPLAFDCLEFNPDFRWIDVISEIAFLIMDLADHQQPGLAQRFLNQYLAISGDYAGCRVLTFYLVYRAMVRAKVDAIRAQQQGISPQDANDAMAEFKNYLELALKYTQAKTPLVMITRGVSGSGKSTITGPLSEKLAAIRIRSDVERKRLFNINPQQNNNNDIAQGIYSKEATEKTYLKLLELAETVIKSGFPVIIDATFSTYAQRKLFKTLANRHQLRFVILEFTAAEETLRQRVAKRENDVSDADIDVLNNQLKHWQALEADEKEYAVTINTEKTQDINQLIQALAL